MCRLTMDCYWTWRADMSAAIQSVNGKLYTPGPASDLYLASGISIDWTYGDQGVYSWTVELRPRGFPGFELPPNQIVPTVEENFAGLFELFDFTMAVTDGDYNVDGTYDCADVELLMDAI